MYRVIDGDIGSIGRISYIGCQLQMWRVIDIDIGSIRGGGTPTLSFCGNCEGLLSPYGGGNPALDAWDICGGP